MVLAALTALAAGAGLAVYRSIITPPRRTLNAAGFDQVRVGMTRAEVEQLLGGPPGDYCRYPGGGMTITTEGVRAPPGSVEQIWFDERNRFEVWFDAEGRVTASHRRGYQYTPPWTLRGLLGL